MKLPGGPIADPPPNAIDPTPGQGLTLDLSGRVPISVLPKYVTGIVTSAGAVTAGTGFTASKTATGTYVIAFTSAFLATPCIQLTLVSPRGTGIALDSATAPATTGFKVWTYDASTSVLTDEAFHFYAIAVT